MIGARRGAVLGACAVLLLLGSAARAGDWTPASPGPLTDEAIVRMVMDGVPEAAIRERIAAGAVAFDLSPGMIGELREAGVSPALVAAMRRRQEQMPRPEPAPVAERTPAPAGILEIAFLPGEGDDAQAPAALALAAAPKGGRGQRPEVPVVSDLAFVVLCTTADHVPDHWDTRTPLSGAPRHEVVLFRAGSEPAPARKPPMLALKHDRAYRVELPPGSHNIVVGAAGKVTRTGEWRLIASDGSRVTIEPGRTTRLGLRARGRPGAAPAPFIPDNAWTIATVEEPAAPSTPAPSAGAPPATSAAAGSPEATSTPPAPAPSVAPSPSPGP